MHSLEVHGSVVLRMATELLGPSDLDVPVQLPSGLARLARQGVVDLTPWHILGRSLAIRRMTSMRERYSTRYVPFAMRQDNDDLACLVAGEGERVVIVHDHAEQGWERRVEHASFWDWFRSAVEDMIAFDD